MGVIVIPISKSFPKECENKWGVKALGNIQGVIIFNQAESLHPWVTGLQNMGHARGDRGPIGDRLVKIKDVSDKVIEAKGTHQHVFALVPDDDVVEVVKKVKNKLGKKECSSL